jgi:hypothetical protein
LPTDRDFDAGERIAMGAAFVAAKEAYARQHRMR